MIMPSRKKYNLTPIQEQIEAEKYKLRVCNKLISEIETKKTDLENKEILCNLDWNIRIHERTISNSKEKLRKIIGENDISEDCSVCKHKVIDGKEYVCMKHLDGLNPCECDSYESVLW